MSKLHKGVDEYLAMRRSLGFGLGGYDTVLHDCARFIDRHSHGILKTDVLLRWATHRKDVSQVWWFHQLGVARGFARFWSAKDSRTEVPPLGLLPKKKIRRKPYLYTDDDVARLIRAAYGIRGRAPLWPATMATLIGLLAVTGMRIGEALALDDRDLDRDTKVFTIRRAKFGKSRLIPLHSTTYSALLEYVHDRDLWHSSSSQSPFFPSSTGKRLKYGQAHRTFGILLEHVGLPRSRHKSGPGLHDLRHRFAINTLLRWYRAGLDVERHIYSLSTYLGHGRVVDTYWYLSAAPELMGLARRAVGTRTGRRAVTVASTRSFATLLEGFFTDRLMRQRQASSHTVAAYRDTFRLLLHHAHVRLKKAPSALALADVDVRFIGDFLDHLEKHRGNGSRTRNARLAAIHSFFFRYVALEEPASSAMTQRILAIPSKRWDRLAISFLSRLEIDALLEAPDQKTWMGRRDHALLLVAVQTGLRASELLAVRHQDIVLTTGAHIRCLGKGRKERCTPLTRQTVGVLRRWIKEQQAPDPTTVLFPSARGGMLSRDGFEYLLAKHVTTARAKCSSLNDKTVSAHTLRHTTAMQLLQAGVDRSVIALWLGHESMETTQVYLHADLAMKERTLTKTAPFRTRARRFKPDDELLAFLAAL